MIKRLAVLLALGFLAAGCRKHEDGSTVSPGGTLPGSGSTVSKTYSGPVAVLDTSTCNQSCKQTIPVNADVVNFPSDSVNVYLCRNVDCATSPIPQTSCATVWDKPAAPCATQMPSPDIVLGKNSVVIVNAFKSYCLDQSCTTSVPGYSSYLIQTVVSR